MPEREAFGEGPAEAPKTGLKIDNKKSRYAPPPAPAAPPAQDFEERADAAVSEVQEKQSRFVRLVRAFMDILGDRTLPENKKPLARQTEEELKDNLVKIAVEFNNDPLAQEDGLGSAALISVLTKAVLMQRDRINQLEHQVHVLVRDLGGS